jgi:uncharacterized RDD family membrane protein YckC
MNIEEIKKSQNKSSLVDDLDFDFKPITSGLGFHHQKATEVKSTFTERSVAVSPLTQTHTPLKKDMNVYQNDLSLFYGQNQQDEIKQPEEKLITEKHYPLATKAQRFFAYVTDLFFVTSILGLVLTVMARTIRMDLMDVWQQYPSEITPLVLILFCGFYLMYFSIFEKASQSTLGKNLFGLRVISINNESLSLMALLLRSTIGLLNFVSLGLFSYFDLQNKIIGSKVIQVV